MESRHRAKEVIHILASVLLLCSCGNEKHTVVSILDTSNIERGMLICRLGNGYFSGVFQELSSPKRGFSHIGIIDKDSSGVYVIHSEASELTAVGFVKRENIEEFIEQSKKYELFLYASDSVRSKAVERAKKYYEQRTPFDAEFDCASDSSVYCTEMVANCLNYAFGKDTIKPLGRMNALEYYTIDGILETVKK